MPNYPYHLARLHGAIKRWIYRSFLKQKMLHCPANRTLPWKVYSFCGEAGLPEQVASVRSFLKHAGAPVSFNIVSDGSITALSKSLLKGIHHSLNVLELDDLLPDGLCDACHINVNLHVLYKKLALLLAISKGTHTIYADSDILFFPGVRSLLDSIYQDGSAASYLLDGSVALDERMLITESERQNPVNSGFLCFRSQIDWSVSFERFQRVKTTPIFFTEQTFTHLGMHMNGASQLPTKKCINRCDDQFIYRDNYASPKIALRHYVSPVRHKFWVQVPLFK